MNLWSRLIGADTSTSRRDDRPAWEKAAPARAPKQQGAAWNTQAIQAPAPARRLPQVGGGFTAAQPRTQRANTLTPSGRSAVQEQRLLRETAASERSARAAEQRAATHRYGTSRMQLTAVGGRPQALPPGMVEDRERRQGQMDATATSAREKADAVAEGGMHAWKRKEPDSLRRMRERAHRDLRERSAVELTPEQFNSLTPRQRTAVEFNTGLLAAAQSPDRTGAIKNFLNDAGVVTRSEEELNAYLQLDQLVTESILDKLDDKAANQQSTESLRWSRGNPAGAPEATRFASARRNADKTAEALSSRLSSSGRYGFGEGKSPAGFGESPRDQVIMQAYINMIDPQYDLTAQDVAQGIAAMNSVEGTDVTPDEVWAFVRSQLDAVDYSRAGNNEGRLFVPSMDLSTGEDISGMTPLDVAEIRRRYGL